VFAGWPPFIKPAFAFFSFHEADECAPFPQRGTGYLWFYAGHDFFDQLPVIINIFPGSNVRPDLLGKHDFIAPSQHFRERKREILK